MDRLNNIKMAIDVYIKANNELSEDTTVFYRLTSNTAYTVNINAYSHLFTLSSSSIPYDLWYVLNHDVSTKTVLPLSTLSSTESFICSSPALCSIIVTLSTTTTLVSSEISASFVKYFLSAGTFEAFPTNIFTNGYEQGTLTPSNYRLSSSGVSFIGEGHTETINLTALSALPAGCSYVWNVSLTSLSSSEGSFYNTVSSLNVVQVNSKYSIVNVPSDSFGQKNSVPIGLKIVNSNFPVNSPNIYRDDVTGEKQYYSHYVSTVRPDGSEYTTNNYVFENIKILTYDTEIQYSFDTGSGGDKIYLSVDKDANNKYVNIPFTATFNLSLSGGDTSLNTCYSLYDTIWTWNNVDVNNLNNDFTNKPFTWGQVSLTGTYPKKWRYESPTSITVTSPVVKTLSSISWSIKSDNGWETSPLTIYDDENKQTFPYNLKYEGIGTVLYTCDFYNDTNITVEATSEVNCRIPVLGGDWIPRDITVNNSGTFDVLTYPYMTLYTPNRYVLVDSTVKFEFVGLEVDKIQSMSVDGNIITPSDTFETSYGIIGDKSLKVSVTNKDGKKVVFEYSNIIKVVDEYDITDVNEGELRSANDPLKIPFLEPPYISPNEWVVEDTINSVIEKMFSNLNYLYIRTLILDTNYDEFFGWYGQNYSMSDAIIAPINLCVYKTWDDLTSENGNKTTWEDFNCYDGELNDGYLHECAPYESFNCDNINRNHNCLGLHCLNWKWSALKSSDVGGSATWKNMKNGGVFSKKWENDGHCESSDGDVIVSQVCNVAGQWNLNEQRDGFENTVYKNVDCNSGINPNCYPVDLASKENIIYSANKTQIRVLSSDFSATEMSVKSHYDKRFSKFKNIQSIALDSKGTLFVLDNALCKIISLEYNPASSSNDPWITNIVWGGIGGLNSNSRFRSPNDIAIDLNDNIIVADTGNSCIKIFTNRGVWVRTITNKEFVDNAPISVTVDDDNNIHVLTSKEIRVYDYSGVYLSSYNFSKYSTGNPTRLSSSYNRLSIYLIVGNDVLKFFKNGVFAAYILDGTVSCIEDVKSVTQDEFRNILITSKEKIIKIVDLLRRKKLISNLPDYYWDLNDVLIDKEEYVQNWVYNRSLQRMWDNIEIFRSALLFDDTTCKGRSSYVHTKNKILIGINEIVTDSVINRAVGYLWDNFNTLLPFFDPNCKE
jgi:hypothetical protein